MTLITTMVTLDRGPRQFFGVVAAQPTLIALRVNYSPSIIASTFLGFLDGDERCGEHRSEVGDGSLLVLAGTSSHQVVEPPRGQLLSGVTWGRINCTVSRPRMNAVARSKVAGEPMNISGRGTNVYAKSSGEARPVVT